MWCSFSLESVICYLSLVVTGVFAAVVYKMADAKPADEVEMSASYSLPATSEQDRELALRATQEFDCGDYESCLATISKLAATRSHDLKVTHNQAVAAYYKSGLTKTDEFKRALTELYSKVCIC